MKKPKKWKVEVVIIDDPGKGSYLYFKDALRGKMEDSFQAEGISIERIKVKRLS